MKSRIKRNDVSDQKLVADAFEDFVSEKRADNKSEKTIHNYTQSFGFFKEINDLNRADSVCADITESMIYKFKNHYLNVDGISKNSINHYIRDVRCVLYYFMEKEWTPAFKIKCVEAQDEGIKFYEEDDIEKLLEKPSKHAGFVEWRTYAICCFILATGARPSTVINVKVSDINFARREIHYAHTKAKNAMNNPLSETLAGILKEYIRMWQPSEWLFPNVGDEQLSVNGLRLAYTKYCKDRDVSRTNLYGLRHTFSRNFILSNGSEIKLMNILGHTSLEMTKRYVRLFGQDLKTDYEDFSMLDQVKKSKSRSNALNTRNKTRQV